MKQKLKAFIKHKYTYLFFLIVGNVLPAVILLIIFYSEREHFEDKWSILIWLVLLALQGLFAARADWNMKVVLKDGVHEIIHENIDKFMKEYNKRAEYIGYLERELMTYDADFERDPSHTDKLGWVNKPKGMDGDKKKDKT